VLAKQCLNSSMKSPMIVLTYSSFYPISLCSESEGKWVKVPCRICVVQRLSCVMKPDTVLHNLGQSLSSPCIMRFKVERWVVMSAIKAKSTIHCSLSSWGKIIIPFPNALISVRSCHTPSEMLHDFIIEQQCALAHPHTQEHYQREH